MLDPSRLGFSLARPSARFALPIYIAMAYALDSMGDEGDTSDETADNLCEVLEAVK